MMMVLTHRTQWLRQHAATIMAGAMLGQDWWKIGDDGLKVLAKTSVDAAVALYHEIEQRSEQERRDAADL